MLTDRKIRILEALIAEFVQTSSPVASRTLVDRYHLGVSSATVRSILADLEDRGLLHQPHTSAGRVPTDSGYRVFVDDFLEREDNRPQTSHLSWEPLEDDVEAFISRITEDVARITRSLVVVTEPTRERVVLTRVNLVPLGTDSAVVILVSDEGRVISRTIELGEVVAPEAITALESRINELVSGLEVMDALKVLSSVYDRKTTQLEQRVLSTIMENGTGLYESRSQSQGMTSLFEQPELRDTRAAIPLLSTMETGSALFDILVDATVDGMVTVRIGSELDIADLTDFAVVAEPYRSDGAIGLIALIGPKRMDYIHSINAVRDGAHALESSL